MGIAFWLYCSIKIKYDTRDEAKRKCHLPKVENNLEFLEYMTCQFLCNFSLKVQLQKLQNILSLLFHHCVWVGKSLSSWMFFACFVPSLTVTSEEKSLVVKCAWDSPIFRSPFIPQYLSVPCLLRISSTAPPTDVDFGTWPKNQYSASSVAQISPNCFVFFTTLGTVCGRSLASVSESLFWNPYSPKPTFRAVATFYQLIFQICGRDHRFPSVTSAYCSA